MQENRKSLLWKKAKDVADKFSNPDREFNYNGETFEIHAIKPLSENTAAVIYQKSGGKLALSFFYWVKSRGGWWGYFFVTDSHVLGMRRLEQELSLVEENNFKQGGIPDEGS